MGKFIDMIKEKIKGTKDKFESTKEEAKDMAKFSSSASSSGSKREFEEGPAGTDIGRKNDPLIEYKRNEPMTPAKIIEYEPTEVKGDPNDQQITEQAQRDTDTEQAKEEYRKRWMSKTDSSDS